LERGQNVATIVITPDGEPAKRAKVAIGVPGSYIQIQNGEIDGSNYQEARLNGDGVATVKFPPQDSDFHIVVTHETGYAHVRATPDAPPETIRLTPWGRIEGVFRVGERVAPNKTLEFSTNSLVMGGQNEPNIYASNRANSDAKGKFTFERVFEGKGWLGRQVVFMVDDGATEVASAKQVPLEVVAGQTLQVELGGDGAAVTGQLAPAEGVKGEVAWQFSQLHARVEVPPTPPIPVPANVRNDRNLAQQWFKEWQLSPEGIAWKGISDANQRLAESSPNFTATVDRDGTFRFDDVPPGNYTLGMHFHQQQPAPGRLGQYKFTVPSGSDVTSEPIDIGVVQLER
jgi:hypothetical protein